jgi:XTP/dITP diphosphohydrolase
VKQNWERLKMREGRESVLDGLPSSLPALLHASRVQEKASAVGFDWEKTEDVWNKVEEEQGELRSAVDGGEAGAIGHEFGDLLFSLVNYARFIGVDPEESLRATIGRFRARFSYMETELRKRGRSTEESTMDEMEDLWQEAKKRSLPPAGRLRGRG